MPKLTKLVISSLVLLLLVSLGGVASGNGAKIPRPPFDIPFSLDQGGETVEVEICIVDRQIYNFGLNFTINRADPSDAQRLRGLMENVPLKIQLQIHAIGNGASSAVFDKTVSEIFLYAWGFDDYRKGIVNIPLEPGLYKVRVKNMLPAPVFAGRHIKFHIYRAYLGACRTYSHRYRSA